MWFRIILNILWNDSKTEYSEIAKNLLALQLRIPTHLKCNQRNEQHIDCVKWRTNYVTPEPGETILYPFN